MRRSNAFTEVTSVLLVILVLITLLTACATPGDDAVETTPAADGATTTPAEGDASGDTADTDPAETQPAYEYADVNYGDATFAILNAADRYNMIYHLLQETVTGDSLEDVRYEVNVSVSERYGIKLTETSIAYNDLQNYAQNEILAQTGDHDVFYLGVKQLASLMSQGYMKNILEIEQFDTSDDWWDELLIDGGTINDKYLFYLGGNYHLQAFEGTTCFYFNKRMATDLGIEYPYQLVRDGKWTHDVLYQYASTAASLNGDESYDLNESGNAVYGYAGIGNMMPAFIMGCDAYYVEKDTNDYPVIAFTSERFTDACNTIAKLTSSKGLYIQDDDLYVFRAGRSLFMGSEIKAAANEMRDMTDEFGLLPVPKYDEAQENYISNMFWATHLLSIPVTCKDVERAAIVMDTLNYEAHVQVMPVYYERVCYKGLRDEDSIEMLEIIRNGRYLNWGLSFGWLDSVEPNVHAQLKVGNGNISSLVKTGTRVVTTLINKTMEKFQ